MTTIDTLQTKLLDNYKSMIAICDENIKSGNDVYWWQSMKRRIEFKMDIITTPVLIANHDNEVNAIIIE